MVKTPETSNICKNYERINKTRKALYDAILLDSCLLKDQEITQETADFAEKDAFSDRFNSLILNQNLTINVGTRTGKPATKEDLESIDSDQRFKTRVNAFSFLSKYWLPVLRSEKLPEIAKRSISPLRIIFDFQEEEIFDIPPERKAGNIMTGTCSVSQSSHKRIRVKRRTKRACRKISDKNNKTKIIKGLSSILSELESQDETKISDYCDMTSLSATKSYKASSKGRKSRVRTKGSNSTKSISSNIAYHKRIARKNKTKKSRPLSISYGQICLSTIVKNLDEISSEL
ncbi:unnamed protein product [Moneuplotes crassus]|uniref:Uncharacterized protein n=1 Tax=Euplotes crassus TaxID=5936 RepID=A0AAD1UA80_EUPCR|nr:unnamed protein product [Moneuplotes crassus]